MKKIILTLCFFLIPLLFLFLFIEIRLRSRQTIYHIQKAQLEESFNSIEVLIMGNSHSFEGINPDYLSKNAFNLGGSGQDYYIDYKLLSLYLDQLPKLSLVVLPVSYHSLFSSLEFSNRDDGRIDFYSRIYGIPRTGETRNLSAYFWIPSYGLKRSFYFAFLEHEMDSLTLKGGHFKRVYDPTLTEYVTDLNLVKRNLSEYDKLMQHELLNWNLSWLEKIIGLLKERNIKPVLVSLPVYKTYYDNLNQEYFSEMQTTTSNLCKEYSLTYLNFLNAPNYTPMDFNNSNHLNELGAIKFSKQLSEELWGIPE